MIDAVQHKHTTTRGFPTNEQTTLHANRLISVQYANADISIAPGLKTKEKIEKKMQRKRANCFIYKAKFLVLSFFLF